MYFLSPKMISSSSEANPKCTQQLSCTRIHVKKTSHGQASVNASFCQKWPSSTYFHCRLRQCARPLETFNRLFTILRVIPEQRKVDVFSSYWTDGYDQNMWQVVKIHMKLKKSCVDYDDGISQKRFCSTPRSSRCQELSNPLWHTFLFPFSGLCNSQLRQLLRVRNELLAIHLHVSSEA